MASFGAGAPVPAAELSNARGGERLRAMTAAEAAGEFEAVLVAELLAAARRAGEPLGSDDEAAGAESYREFADRFLAGELARSGALGVGRLILREIAPSDPRGLPGGDSSTAGLNFSGPLADRATEEAQVRAGP